MESNSASNGDAQTILLGGDLTITGAAGIKSQLEDALASGGDITIRIGSFDGLDLTCLQLVCSFHRTAVSKGRKARLDYGSSAEFGTYVERTGFLRQRGCRYNPDRNCLWCKEDEDGKNYHDRG